MSKELNQSVCFQSAITGPRLIIVGAVHGNETCGAEAIRQIIAEFNEKQLTLKLGRVTFVPVANPMAYELGQRCGERNLNRMLMPYEDPLAYEDHLANWLCPLLSQHDVLLDLHSFQGIGQAFVMVGPENNVGNIEPFQFADQEKALAKILGIKRAVDGWLKTYERGIQRRQLAGNDAPNLHAQNIKFGIGTTEYMRSQGGYGLTLECGNHLDPNAPTVARRAILNTLAHLGMIDVSHSLVPRPMESLQLYDVIDKSNDGDFFSQPWASFDPLRQGQVIGYQYTGEPVLAPKDGFIVFPDPTALEGDEWFYLAQINDRFA